MAFTAGQKLTALLINEVYGLVSRKTADETVNNSNTLQDDNDLTWALQASQTYHLTVFVAFNTGATPDIKIGWTVPSGSSMRWSAIGADTALAFTARSNFNSSSVPAFGGDATDRLIQISGIITTSTTADNLIMRWAQNTANASDTKVLTGTYGVVRRLV